MFTKHKFSKIAFLPFYFLVSFLAVTHLDSPVWANSGDNGQPVSSIVLEEKYPQASLTSDEPVSRAELAAIASIYPSNSQEASNSPIALEDVPTSHWAYPYISTAIAKELMQPYRDARFFPNTHITRAEGYSVLTQAAGIPQVSDAEVDKILSPFPDASETPDWARRNFAIAIAQGYVKTDEGLLRPKALMTQGNVAFAITQQIEQGSQIPTEVLNLREFLDLAVANPEAVAALQVQPNETTTPNSPFPWKLALFSSIGILLIVTYLLQKGSKSKRSSRSQPKPVKPQPSIKSYKVRELEVSPRGAGTNRQLKQEAIHSGGIGSQITFGTEGCIYTIADNLPGATKLFTITTLSTGVKVTPQQPALLFEGKPLPANGLTLPAHQTFTLQFKTRQWEIEPSSLPVPTENSTADYLAKAWEVNYE